MAEQLENRIIEHLKGDEYRPQRPRGLARELNVANEEEYHAFRDALKELMHAGHVVLGARGAVMLPAQHHSRDEFVGSYRHNKRGFGFVVPTDPGSREDLYIPEGQNAGAITGDVVRAKIMSKGQRDGKAIYSGRITEIMQRTQKRFVGALVKQGALWMVLPEGNSITEPILTPDAAGRHVKPGSKVVVEMTEYPAEGQRAVGVITEVLGEAGEKDVDLRSVIVQFNLPGEFPPDVLTEARLSVDRFNPDHERANRIDLSDQVICTIDPDDAKDYDDAISLRELDNGNWELGVHIADVSHFVPGGSALDEEAKKRGNSAYFPGHVIPMLPEILSNGVCSLQERVPRFCKSAFITYDEAAKPISAKFANTIITSARRLRYKEAQAILDAIDAGGTNGADLGKVVPHPDGERRVGDYEPHVIKLLGEMNSLARRLQKRRLAAGQLVLDLPEVELVLDENGKVADAVPEDTSFTHTLIEMFMVEANEAVARLLNSQDLPFLRRIHPEPEGGDSDRLKQFVTVAGFKMPKLMDRHTIQALLTAARGKPEAFAINLAVLRSLTRAEYSPQQIGHYALASEQYCHFTSPIRRYADLTIHRLLDAYFSAREDAGRGKPRVEPDDVPSFDDLVALGKQLSFTERRAEDAERELRQVKILELLKERVGEEFPGVVTGITNFGIFVQLSTWLIDGLIRYEHLMDDWWDVNAKAGVVHGQRTGQRIGIGDVATVTVVRVDVARRELDLSIKKIINRGRPTVISDAPAQAPAKGKTKGGKARNAPRGGGAKRPTGSGRGPAKHEKKARKRR
jgi:ribonuclease R